MKIIKGDLIDLAKRGKFDYIIHGCNCHCQMGKGIAAQIAKEFPQAWSVDAQTATGDIFKLGNYTITEAYSDNGHEFKIVNAYTQYYPGPDFQQFALWSALFKLQKLEKLDGQTLVGVPWIGCGIGGSSKDIVLPIFEHFSKKINLTIVDY